MNKQAWVGIYSDQPGRSKEAGFCDLDKTRALFEEFDRYSREDCPTLTELEAEDAGAEPLAHDHLDFDVCFGRRHPGSQRQSRCYLSVSALKPSGYFIVLTVPRYGLGWISIPKGMIFIRGCRQYVAREGGAITRDQVTTMLHALFQKHDRELAGWAASLPGLKQTY